MGLNSKLELIIKARERDIGGFMVRRMLPFASHRMVGPFVFFDYVGPGEFKPGQGLDVRPHPHINLATVTYLFEGKFQHRDSLGSNQIVEPGAINWMTAGRGIVHSERTPEPDRRSGSKIHGIQLWVALPREHEETAPSFSHHPKETLPEFKKGEAKIKILLGRAFGKVSPVKIYSDLFYVEINLAKGSSLTLPVEGRESALQIISGSVSIEGQEVKASEMAVGKTGEDLTILAVEDSHVMAIGGSSVGERFLYWNFVSSSKERLEEAKANWSEGPHSDNSRFHPIPGDDQEFIPLP